MPCSKLEVSTVQHGTLSGAGYLHQSLLAQEVGSDGITVNAICPGIILTEMGKNNSEARRRPATGSRSRR
jgi:NAD(P)-dependent dehydrogenase (short-subunit alcohol dehydrogenase family)